jgi:hypothetical protein
VPADLTDGNLLADISCLDGEILVWDGLALAWGCGLDQDSVLTEAEVDAMVADNGYALASDLATVANSGDYNDLLNIPADVADGDADTLADISCSATQVAKWNGANWACADDTDTVLDEADVDAFVSNNGFASASDIFSGAWSALTGVPADADTVGSLTCASNQVAVFNGGSWVCGDNHDESADIAALTSDIAALTADIAALHTTIEELEASSSAGVGDGVLYGNYTINNNVDLAGLAGYTTVTGNLKIEDTAFPSLADLESLTYVGGHLTISNNAFTSLEGLNNLTSVDGDLDIYNNAALTSLEGLNSLTVVGDSLYIHYNDALTSLAALNSVTSVGHYLQITNNSALSSLAGVNSVTSVGFYLQITDNSALTSLEGLDSLTSVGVNVNIYNNDALISLEGLNNLSSVGGNFQIWSNATLISLEGLDSLTSVGAINIYDNPALCQTLVDAFVSILESFGWSGTTYTSGNDNSC